MSDSEDEKAFVDARSLQHQAWEGSFREEKHDGKHAPTVHWPTDDGLAGAAQIRTGIISVCAEAQEEEDAKLAAMLAAEEADERHR